MCFRKRVVSDFTCDMLSKSFVEIFFSVDFYIGSQTSVLMILTYQIGFLIELGGATFPKILSLHFFSLLNVL